MTVAIAHLFEGPAGPKSFNISDQQALCSLLAFNVGAFLCRWGDTFGPHKRAYTVINSFTATLFNMAAAICIWQSGEIGIAESRVTPAWTKPLSFAAIGFMSASLGMQGFQGKRLNTQFATCVVLTTVWVELMTDPGLFKLRQKVISRDHKVIAAFSLFLGAFIARAILYKIGPAGCLGIATGIRLLITISWFFVPAKPEKKNAN
ncbi:hypothetical protein VNI00_012299 [Paramarasmius palmivorus]|uniref:DUF1275 domain protein n=1 Tax=Paramarasmius palmivorus TaxID=297713 RepID=A0AAW0C6X9_9AGAR